MTVDEITLRFDASSLTVLNVILALLMFGVALGMQALDPDYDLVSHGSRPRVARPLPRRSAPGAATA